MTSPVLLVRNADVYAPEHLGQRDILIAGGKIVAVEEKLDVSVPGMETLDAAGRRVAPGLIDQHIHVTGGGGEGGWASRCPEMNFSALAGAGVTTFVGVSGTDSMSRSIENLLAKVRGLTVEGASGWMWTSNYAFPPTTITGSAKMDIFTIPECLGVKIAMGDHRASFPTPDEVLRLLSEIRIAGMLTGKTGFLHIHCGNFAADIFDALEYAVRRGIPAKHSRPTHVARHPEVFERACAFAKAGGFIDITTGGGCYQGSAAKAFLDALEKGVPVEHLTFSSDGQGSMPRFNDAGEMVGFGVGSIKCDLEAVQAVAAELGLETALKPMTTSIADALGLPGKGRVAVGCDADLIVLNDALALDEVFMKGRGVMREGKVVVKGAFEE
ncbi:beta-aspartyl-peptidase [Sutterella sp.]|uniref:beta-aspartyl-peptidase n=1 Tax=Sutterella sp. TaxID=1981025 RepID=UPI0026DEB9AC|nr:beta-aspartyl-peptidase [Sutterella sp.]MDO5530976.1 beta-aspartyl-peptidase [Sutterella sp.]